MDGSFERLARRLARSDTELIASRTVRRAQSGESVLDGLSRALAAPVTRRRAVAVIGGTVMAGSLLRPGRARADCWPGGPQVCQSSKGAKVCVPYNLQCCSNENCAIACPYSYRDCTSPARCDDTPRMCATADGRQEAGVSDAFRTKFCSKVVTVPNGCVDAGESEAVRGWCCRPNDDCWFFTGPGDPIGFGGCKCPDNEFGARDCGDKCCAKDEICVTTGSFLSGSNQRCLPHCPKGWHYDETPKCVCDDEQTCGLKCCPAGKVCQNNRCVSPAETSGSFKDFFKSFGDFTGGDSSNQAGGSRGGGNYLRIGAKAAAATPVRTALLSLAAVNAQGAAAANAITDTHSDRAYRRRVVAAKPRLPKLAGTPGFDPAAAAALDALLAAQAGAFAQIAAAATALARSRGALRARSNAQARRQALAAAKFASAAAKGLRRLPGLRGKAAAALNAAGIAEVNVAATDVAALAHEVETSGIPADLTALLKSLGMTGDDLKRARKALLVPSFGGPALIGPLTDRGRNANLSALARELAKYARKLRRSPIQRSRPRPKRLRPPAAARSR